MAYQLDLLSGGTSAYRGSRASLDALRKKRDQHRWPSHASEVVRKQPSHSKEAKRSANERAKLRGGYPYQQREREEAAQRAEAKRLQREANAEARAIERRRKDAEYQARKRQRKWQTRAEEWAYRYKNDPAFNLKERMRAHFRRERQGIDLGKLLRSALRKGGESPAAERFVGYTAADLAAHLQRQFTGRMTWAAFLAGRIHIDHIVPLASFDVSNPIELKQAWALTNLRPLWAKENKTKHATRTLLI